MSEPQGRNPYVYISVLNWNGAEKTIRCLESLRQLHYSNYRILVVDNASMDDSVERIRAAFPHVEIICSQENLGYAGGNRLALEYAIQNDAELFWILNNDAIVEPDALTALVEAYVEHGPAVYGSAILQPSNPQVIAFAGGWSLDANGRPRAIGVYNAQRGRSYADCFDDQQNRLVGTVNGCSLMVPLAVVRKYGFMDESFFMNTEEVDYCFRLGKLGIPSRIVSRSVVFHEWGGSYKSSTQLSAILYYYLQRNNFVFIKRHEGWFAFIKKIYKYIRNTWRLQVVALSSRNACTISSREYMGRRAILDAILNRMGKRYAPEEYLNDK